MTLRPLKQRLGKLLMAAAPVSAADLVAASVARGLRLGTSVGELTSDRRSYPRGRRLLLVVLDNCWCWTTLVM